MKQITLQDVKDTILGTDIKILSQINILDMSNLNNISPNLFGVYIINLKYKESYIGMSSSNKGIIGRLSRHLYETWHRNIVDSINIFVTNEYNASYLEKILVKTFKPELNTTRYENCSIANFITTQRQLECGEDTYKNVNIEKEYFNNIIENDKLNTLQKFDQIPIYEGVKRRRRPVPIPLYENEESIESENIYKNDYEERYRIDYKESNFITWLKAQKGRNDPIGDIAIDLKNGLKVETIWNRYYDILYDAYNEYKYIYLTDYRNQSENFGLILINSLNPKLREQLSNNNDFDFNYKMICKKYDEISTIKNKNMSNAWEELHYNNMKNDDILSNNIKYWNEHTKKRQDNFNLKDERIKIIKENYNKLLSEIDNEIEELLKKYGKNKEYIKENFYYSLINHDIKWFSDKHE